MALVVKDRVQETTTTTGTGTVTLAGAEGGFQTFAAIGDGNTTYYAITSGTDWESGIGTYTASGTTLSRDTILASSNGGSAISLTGTSKVFCTYPAEKSVSTDVANTFTANQTISATSGIPLTLSETDTNDALHLTGGNDPGDSYVQVRGDNEGGIRIRGGGSNNGGAIELSGGARDTDPGIIKFSTGTSSSGTERMRIDSSGNVGIGTSSPDGNLHVDAGSASDGYAIVSGGTSATMVINGDTDNSGDAGTSDAKLVFTGDGSYDSSVNSGFGSYSYVIHQLNQSGVSSLAFTETRGAGTVNERMRIDNNGNVGIGTDSPATNLHIADTAVGLRLEDTDNSSYGGLIQSGVVLYLDADLGGTSGEIRFRTAGGTEHMRVASSGYVTKPNQCYFRVRTDNNTTAQTGQIPWTDEVVDIGNNFASNQFTAPVDGVYFFAHNNIAGNNGNVNNDVSLYVNGAALNGTRVREDSGTSNYNTYNIVAIVNLSANDTVDVRVTSGQVYANSVIWTSFHGYLLG